MAVVEVNGSLVESPPTASDQGGFPSATTTIPFSLSPPQKPVSTSTGRKLVTVNSANAFVTLFGGGDLEVTQGATIYVRVAGPGFQLRVTFNNPQGAPIVSVLPCSGLLVFEPDAPSAFWVTKLEAQGAGQVEFYASGIQ